MKMMRTRTILIVTCRVMWPMGGLLRALGSGVEALLILQEKQA